MLQSAQPLIAVAPTIASTHLAPFSGGKKKTQFSMQASKKNGASNTGGDNWNEHINYNTGGDNSPLMTPVSPGSPAAKCM